MVNTLLKIRLHLKSRNKIPRCRFSFQCYFGLLVPLLITLLEILFLFSVSIYLITKSWTRRFLWSPHDHDNIEGCYMPSYVANYV
ncbi:hypothetical protein H5410_009842 [Solanum commersonii]|uniref:Uncharacterized protein n=1 Tax=Solanum commersonii TaxID=4109 RepID=A0A9J6AJ22_SOLCO|nr:hypothetical protein H5410_009842 [Solanum commersonii]